MLGKCRDAQDALKIERADRKLAFADAGPVPFDLVLVNLDETCKSLEYFLSP